MSSPPPLNTNDLRLRKLPPFRRPSIGRGLPLPSPAALLFLLLFLFRFDGNAGSFVCVARSGDAIYMTRLSKPTSYRTSHPSPLHTQCRVCVYTLRVSLRAFWDKCAALRRDESTVMVAIEIVCGMHGAITLLHAMLCVPRDRGMAALLRLEGCVLV